LSPRNKAELASLLRGPLRDEGDIFGPKDLNALLREFQDIEKSHIKLWLSGAAMLESILRAANRSIRAMTMKEIEFKVRVYAQNPSFDQAYQTLESQHVLIVAGPPGVGKTTLAEMLAYAYIADGWNLVVIRDLDDGFNEIDDTQRQIFYFDDFLGRVALDRRALAHKDSDLARLIRRINASPNARFILTTRAYIFEEARQVSEHLADRRLDLARYMLDVGVYTRQIKARIIYNHLLIAKTPQEKIDALVRSGKLPEIIDHRNYNPRIVEWMTDLVHIGNIGPDEYPAAFLETLKHPKRLWDIAFRTHISRRCQDCLIALFFCSQYSVDLEDFRIAYDGLHARLSEHYGQPREPKDFEDAVRTLEGSFITIQGTQVSFINPSLRDYLTGYLDDLSLLEVIASSATQTQWAQAVWQHATGIAKSLANRQLVASAFIEVAHVFLTQPVYRRHRQDGYWYRTHGPGLSITDRIDLLLSWFSASENARFAEIALQLSQSPIDGLDSSYDGDEAIRLIINLREEGYYEDLSIGEEIALSLERAFIKMLRGGMPSDDLEKISDAVEQWKKYLGDGVQLAVQEAVEQEVDEVRQNVANFDSESTLEDHIKTLRTLSKRAGILSQKVEKAVEIVQARIAELRDETPEPTSPSIKPRADIDTSAFDDAAIANLFASLVSK
jgi:energy-coupling factor transporter ATP-binding protein EcfA2